MKRLLLLVMCLLSCSAPHIKPGSLYRSMIMPQVIDQNGEMVEGGTAFSIGNDLFLTANHVCRALNADNLSTQMMYFSDKTGTLGFTSSFEIVKTDETNDICLIRVPNTNSIPFDIAQHDSFIGDVVYSYGCTAGVFGFLSSGFLIDNNIQMGSKNILMSSAPGWFGQSGGPLINEAGQVIGITVSVYNSFHHIQISPPTRVIREFISEFKER